jgi:uncharacterized membrane protein
MKSNEWVRILGALNMNRRLIDLPHVGAYVSIVFSGAIFGFFYAWVCSTMWGLDSADPRVAIEAMQEMNDSVQNAVFFPAFFLTPVVLGATAWVARRHDRARAARFFAVAAVTYLVGALIVTMAINVPMNDDLANEAIPTSTAEAERIWDDYSGPWQVWNTVRTAFSGVSLVLAALGLAALGVNRTAAPPTAAQGARREPTAATAATAPTFAPP